MTRGSASCRPRWLKRRSATSTSSGRPTLLVPPFLRPTCSLACAPGNDRHVSNNGDGGVVARAAAELYAGLPEDFTGRRRELAAATRAAGDREAARLISALRKP